MALEYQIVAALGLDLAIGDPRWLPHPVRLMGRLAQALERPLRQRLPARLAGVLVVVLVLATTAAAVLVLLAGARSLHPGLEAVLSVLLLYTTLAARDLHRHADRVRVALVDGDLPLARERVGWMVGRDTTALEPAEVARAAVESVAENTVDGVTAPLFFAVVGGPVGAMLYKAVNTLDSTFGYKNARYLRFGWAAARLDDVVNAIPARLSAPVWVAAAALLRLDARGAARVLWRDHDRHPSPNAGLSEAAVAGALGVELGGANSYQGQVHEKPRLGDPRHPLGAHSIAQACRLMLVSTVLFAVMLLAARGLVLEVWHG